MAFFFPFSLGAIAKKEKWVERVSNWTDNHFRQRKGWYEAKSVLMYLGKHSMNIWLIHGWICFYLFTDVICMAKYPMGIFLVILVWSLLVSIVVDFVYKHLFARYF